MKLPWVEGYVSKLDFERNGIQEKKESKEKLGCGGRRWGNGMSDELMLRYVEILYGCIYIFSIPYFTMIDYDWLG